MEIVEIIDVLNKLVAVHNDRIDGYFTASEEIEEQELEKMFIQFAKTSQKCSRELADEIGRLGGSLNKTNGNAGKFFRTWIVANYSVTANDRKLILDSCESGEDHAVNTYEKVLKEDLECLNTEQIDMINSQYTLIKNDHFRLKALCNSMVV